MRRCIEILAVMLALSASAFDSASWLKKRDRLTAEAERLRNVYSNCVAQVATPADEVSVPIESFPDGSIKAVVHAKKAQYFQDSGLVWAQAVEVRKFQRDGTLDSTITAEYCVIDRFSKSGWAEGAATVTRGKTTLAGEGVFFSSAESYVKVLNKTHVVSKDLKLGGLRQ